MHKIIIISPYSRVLRNGQENPKNYPYWQELVELLKSKNCFIVQIGVEGEQKLYNIDECKFGLKLGELKNLVDKCDFWFSVDNFFQHFCHLYNKPGVAIFGQSDPLIFGHKENLNLLKDRKYLREKQFDIWESCTYNKDVFIEPSKIFEEVSRRFFNE